MDDDMKGVCAVCGKPADIQVMLTVGEKVNEYKTILCDQQVDLCIGHCSLAFWEAYRQIPYGKVRMEHGERVMSMIKEMAK